jgi:hypothetical protein
MVCTQIREEAAMGSGLEPSTRGEKSTYLPDGPGRNGDPERWLLIRDALFLQPKLVLEGLKDLLLGPVALVAAGIDLVRGSRPGRTRAFYEVLRVGRQFEGWLNLYGALPAEDADETALVRGDPVGIDAQFGRIEQALLHEHARGGVTTRLRRNVDLWLDKLDNLTRK